MKVGTDDKRKTAIAIGLGVVAVGLVIYELMPSGNNTAANLSSPVVSQPIGGQTAPAARANRGPRRNGRGPVNKPSVNTLDPTIRLDLFDQAANQHYRGSGRNIFEAYIPPPPQPKPQPQPVVQPQVQVPQGPPPINLKFYGWASRDGQRRVFLAQGDEIFVAAEGQLVANRYKIVKITDNAIQVEDILNNNTQSVPIT